MVSWVNDSAGAAKLRKRQRKEREECNAKRKSLSQPVYTICTRRYFAGKTMLVDVKNICLKFASFSCSRDRTVHTFVRVSGFKGGLAVFAHTTWYLCIFFPLSPFLCSLYLVSSPVHRLVSLTFPLICSCRGRRGSSSSSLL